MAVPAVVSRAASGAKAVVDAAGATPGVAAFVAAVVAGGVLPAVFSSGFFGLKKNRYTRSKAEIRNRPVAEFLSISKKGCEGAKVRRDAALKEE